MSSPVFANRRVFLVDRIFVALSIFLGAVQAWIGRQTMGPDGVSYLDIGDAYLRGDWKAAINGYWSPMYSLLLGAAARVLKPGLRWEFPVAHLVNFLVYLAALFCFRLLLISLMKSSTWVDDDQVCPLPGDVFIGLAYIVFLWSCLVLNDLIWVTPDLLLTGLIFLLAALLVDLHGQNSFLKFAAFGAVCGFGYLTKGVMFPMSFVFVGVLLLSGTRLSKARIAGVLIATCAFLIVSGPFVWALSESKGRFTFGDTSRLAYANLVSPRAPQINWQGETPGAGTPLHPTRKLLDDPPVFEYAEPIAGTYPPWYDPSFWNEGMRWNFQLRSQLRVVVESALNYGSILQGFMPLIVVILFFLLLGGRRTWNAIVANWFLLVPAITAMVVYSLVLVLPRYISGFAALFFLAILSGIRLAKEKSATIPRLLSVAVITSMLFSLAVRLENTSYHMLTVGHEILSTEQIEAAEGLQPMGLHPNDRVAILGDPLVAYWARLGKFKIVAEISSPDIYAREFWAAPPDLRARALEAVRHAKAKFLVTWDPPVSGLTPDWKHIAGTRFYAYSLAE